MKYIGVLEFWRLEVGGWRLESEEMGGVDHFLTYYSYSGL